MLSKYDIDEMVAQSAESVVFAGVERDGGAAMQLRRYLTRVGGKRRDGDVQRFAAELEKVRGLEAPHLMGILEADFDAQDDNPHFITRTPEGDSLLVMLGGALLAEEDAVRLAEEALDGLEWLHGRGLVHGGLRADRLRWSRHHGVWLTEVGMERALMELGDFAELGEEATTAPELRGVGARTAAGDVYALGATIYQLLTGKPAPCEAGAWPGVGDGSRSRWDGWIAALCAADPQARPDCATARSMLRIVRADAPAAAPGAVPMLVRVAAPVTPTARVVGEPRPSVPVARQAPRVTVVRTRRRAGLAWVAALVVIGLGGGGYLLGHRELINQLVARIEARPPGTVDETRTGEKASAPLTASHAAIASTAASTPTSAPMAEAATTAAEAPLAASSTPGTPPAVAGAPDQVAVRTVAEPAKAKAGDSGRVERPERPVRTDAGAAAALPGPAADGFFGPRDNAAILQQRGKPGAIRGTVQKVAASPSGTFLDITFQGGDCMAFLRVAPGTIIDITQLQAFKGKQVEVRGVLDVRPWGPRERPGVKFSDVSDISLVPR